MLFWGDKLFFPHYVHAIVHTVCLPNQVTLHVHNSSLSSVSDRCWPNKSLPETLTSLVLEHKHRVSHTVWIFWMSQLSSVSGDCDLTSQPWYVSNCQSHKVVKFSPFSVKNSMTVCCHNESHIISTIKILITLNWAHTKHSIFIVTSFLLRFVLIHILFFLLVANFKWFSSFWLYHSLITNAHA